jgi:hypothetical protein
MQKTLVCIFLFVLLTGSSQAQIGSYSFSGSSNVLYNDGYGIPWSNSTLYNTDGSPFYDTSFCIGSIQLLNGKMYSGIKLKLNLEEQKIIFEVEDGKAFVLSIPVSRVELGCTGLSQPTVFRSGFTAIDKQNERSLYQVLDSGKVLLLKYTEIRFKDSKAYNSNDMTRSYRQLPSYYLWVPGKDMIKISTNENDLLAMLSDQQKLLNDAILKEKWKVRKEADLIKIIALYNRSSTKGS